MFTDEYVLRAPTLDPQFIQFVPNPSMVISAFSIELFLKCILIIEKQPAPLIHNLASLYKRISHKRKRRIDLLWEQHARPRLSHFATSENMPTDLGNALARCSTAFERLRYAYEDYANVVYYLGDLPPILRNIVLEIHPDWGLPSKLMEFKNPDSL
jgi:hypothetical protein